MTPQKNEQISFQPAVLIQKKRDGKVLTPDEIKFFVKGVTEATWSDAQIGAWLMAVTIRGMTLDETVALTDAMLRSGERFEYGPQESTADKHSTGGLGDKVTLLLAPLAAACGLKVPSMAGRALGHTGGTLDKLESIPGFKVYLDKKSILQQLKEVGCVVFGQTAEVCPADRKLYATRDVTATVECIPLIVASILSKKLAEGTKTLVMDVKVGSGAFMKTKKQAKELSKNLIKVAKKLGLQCRVLITDMSQPLGETVGNSLEVLESVELLKTGRGAADLKEITIALCAHMLHASRKVKTYEEGRKLALSKLEDGSAWEKFKEMAKRQGAQVSALNADDVEKTLAPTSSHTFTFRAHKRAYVSGFDGERLGRLLISLGGGRKVPTDILDPRVGFRVLKKTGAKVEAKDPLLEVFLKEPLTDSLKTFIQKELSHCIHLSASRPKPAKLIEEVLLS